MSEFRFYTPATTQTRTTSGSSWSVADIRLLRELAQQGLPLDSIARVLGRTQSAIKNKAGMHGISLQRLQGLKDGAVTQLTA
jgi:hypothetical protein